MITCTWILLLWKDQLYLSRSFRARRSSVLLLWKDHLYLDPVVLKGSAVPGSCCCERISCTCTWILLLWKDELYLDPVVVKGSTVLVPRSSCVRRFPVPGSCCVKGLVSWDDAVTGRPQVQCALSWILLKISAVPVLESCCCEKDQLYLDPVVLKGLAVLLWKDQLYLDPVVWKVQYLEMMQWLEGPGSDALYPGSCCSERISCTCT